MYITYIIYIYIYEHIGRAGDVHVSMNNLKTDVLDKFDVLLALNGNSSLSKR